MASTTELRQLGKNGPQVNPLGLGCMGMSSYYGPFDDNESIRVLEKSIELGYTFWDTADLYGNGLNERLLSQVLKKHRDQVFLCSKFGHVLDPETGKMLGISGKPDYVRFACEKSLERLGVDVIDLYYQHRVDSTTPIEETVSAMAELVKEGKVRYLGLSECSADTLRRAYKVHPITAVQVEYSPWALDIENNGVLEAARELGVAVVAYSPLGRGILTGNITSIDDLALDDIRRYMPRYSPENFPKNLELVEKIKALAAKKGVTASQFVLAWILHQGQDFFVIPGTKRMKYFEENIVGGQIKLSEAEVAEMRQLVEKAQPDGLRYGKEYIDNFCYI
ncbi:auxin-induced protein [Fennellomyces sp. T-0311]|nr:auxin-induced protein [Fennellomyces sp. T-0311]